MIIFYSGDGSRSNPEYILGDRACLMLTYNDFHAKCNGKAKPNIRFKRILKARKRGRK